MRIGPYEVIELAALGGQGSVHRARAPDGREVAIKLLRTLDEEAVARFERERRLLEGLRETDGFVPLLDHGDLGPPEGAYVVLPWLAGGTLRARLEERQRLGVAETVALGLALSRALGIAHARGVVHRDLKPENVLFTSDGKPLVADLGLGKHWRRDVPGASASVAITGSGEGRGTAGYMAPEQFRDVKNVGPPADVFALGSVLYECLAGQPPHDGPPHAIVARFLAGERPEPLGTVRPDVPAWLVRVIDRALAIDAGARFADGAALHGALDRGHREAAALGATSRASTVETAPPQRPGRTRVLAATIVLGTLAAILLGSEALRPGSPPALAPVASPDARSTPALAPVVSPATPSPAFPGLCRGFLASKRLRLAAVLGSYDGSHGSGAHALATDASGRLALTGSEDGWLRLWAPGEDGSLPEVGSLAGHGGWVTACALSPDGRSALSGGADGTVRLWDVEGRREQARLEGGPAGAVAAVALDGSRAAALGADGTVALWDLASPGPPLVRRLPGGAGCALALARGRCLLGSADGRARLLDAATGEDVQVFAGHAGAVRAVAFGGQGAPVTAGDDGTVRRWDVANGAGTVVARGAWRILSLAVSPDGSRAAAGHDATIEVGGGVVWIDLVHGREERSLETHQGDVFGLAFLPSGRVLAAGGWGSLRSLDPRATEEPAARGAVLGVAFLPDGRLVAAGVGPLRVWDPARATRPPLELAGNEVVASAVAAVPPLRAITASWDRSVRLFDAGAPRRGELLARHDDPATSVAVSPDGRAALSGGRDGLVLRHDVAASRTPEVVARLGTRVLAVALSPGGAPTAGGADGAVVRWSGAEPAVVGRHEGEVRALAYLPDGRLLSGGSDGRVKLWGAAPGPALADHPSGDEVVEGLAVAPGGALAASAGSEGGVVLWDLERGDEVDRLSLATSEDLPRAVAFAPYGRSLAVGTVRGVVLVFEVRP